MKPERRRRKIKLKTVWLMLPLSSLLFFTILLQIRGGQLGNIDPKAIRFSESIKSEEPDPGRTDTDKNNSHSSKVNCKVPPVSDKPFRFSQSRFDKLLYRTLYQSHDKCGEGVILECGALDGKLFSNSFFFDKFLHWRAIHVEASPINFPILQRNRPQSTNLNFAICKEDFVTFLYDSKKRAAGGISDTMNAFHRENFASDMKEAKVTCTTFEKLFEENLITHIDVLVLDVEGGELSAMETINFDKVQIDVFVVELDGKNLTNDYKARDLLKQNGYIRILEDEIEKKGTKAEKNDVWAHKYSDVIKYLEKYH